MLKVSKKQIEEIRAIYGAVETKSTRHGVYIVGNSENMDSYKRLLRGDLSKRQKNKLYWHYLKHGKTQKSPQAN